MNEENSTYKISTNYKVIVDRMSGTNRLHVVIYDFPSGKSLTPYNVSNLSDDFYIKLREGIVVLLRDEAVAQHKPINYKELRRQAIMEAHKYIIEEEFEDLRETGLDEQTIRDRMRVREEKLVKQDEELMKQDEEYERRMRAFQPVHPLVNPPAFVDNPPLPAGPYQGDHPPNPFAVQQQSLPQNQFSQQDDSSYQGGHQVIPTIGQIVVIILVISIIVCTILYILKTYYSPVIIEEDVTKYKHKSKYTDSE